MLEWFGLGDFSYVLRVMMILFLNCFIKVVCYEVVINMFSLFDELFLKIGVNFKDVKVFVVNCSLFNFMFLLFVMIVNRYKMCGDIKSINIGGMGCSVGLIVIDFVKDFL